MLLCLIALAGRAQQFELAYPMPRLVVQRGADGNGKLYLSGRLDFAADRIEAQFTPASPGQGTASAWQVIQTNPQGGVFYGSVVGVGGWYVLTVRAIRNNIIVGETSVQPVGIGEVFITAGQSNSRGLGNGDNDLGTATDRVSTIDTINHYYPPGQSWFSSGDPMPVPNYKSMTASRRVFPMGESSWGWGELGDYIVSRYNVPVIFYNAGWDASTVENWINSANGIPACNRYWCPPNSEWANLQPYTNLKNILQYYGSTGGVRSVLWHQGEAEYGDANSGSIPVYANRLYELIDRSRSDFGGRKLPWVVARVSFDGSVTRPSVVSKQQEVINIFGFQVFQGPLNDTIVNRRAGTIDVHFGNAVRPTTHPQYFNNPNAIPTDMGLSRFARNWNNSLSNSFFQNATPLVTEQFAVTGKVAPIILPADSVSLPVYTAGTFGADNGWQVQLLDSAGRFLRYLPSLPGNPVRTKLPDDLSTGWFRLRVLATNPVTPAVPTNKFRLGTPPPPPPPPPPPRADVSLSMQASQRVVRVGETFSVQIHVQNTGPDPATNVQVLNRLPANLSVVSASGFTTSTTALSGTISQLASGSITTFSYQARVISEGVYRNAVEVIGSDVTDPDSQPGTGTQTGQDDEARIEWRTPQAGTSVFESPNPNQITLPPVQSSQPVPNSATADLSLNVVVSNRAPALNEIISVSMIVTNGGGASASSISVGIVLPGSLSYVGSLTAVGQSVTAQSTTAQSTTAQSTTAQSTTATSQTVTGTVNSLPAGSVATLVFQARVLILGEAILKAQVTLATPADPDSTPNNGTENGEDDTAWAVIRVR